jgi:hypothetical protein
MNQKKVDHDKWAMEVYTGDKDEDMLREEEVNILET